MTINLGTTFTEKPSRYLDISLGVIMAMGVFIRLVQYVANRSLWKDEAMLALNIVNRSFSQLLQPLDYNQGAPLSFLMGEKVIGVIFGYKDYVLRLIPVIAGCVSVWLMYCLVKQIVSPPTAVIVVVFFSFSTQLIYYSSELKQYSVDVAIVLLLYLLAAPLLKGEPALKKYILLGLIGVVSLITSHPAIFVLGGISLGLILYYFFRKDYSQLLPIGIMILAWLFTFAVLFFLSYKDLTINGYLTHYWRKYFMPIFAWEDIAWFSRIFQNIFEDLVDITSFYFIEGFLSIIGSIILVIRKWQWGIPFLATLFLNLAASAMHKFPFGGRLFLYSLPILLIFIGMSLEFIFLALKRSPRLSSGIWFVCALFLIYKPLTSSLDILHTPLTKEEIKPVIEYLIDHYRENDIVYVYYGAIYPLRYYAPYYGLHINDFVIGSDYRDTPQKYMAEIKKLRGHKRVWFVFSHLFTDEIVNERDVIFSGLYRIGKVKERYKASNAYIFLYDMSQSP